MAPRLAPGVPKGRNPQRMNWLILILIYKNQMSPPPPTVNTNAALPVEEATEEEAEGPRTTQIEDFLVGMGGHQIVGNENPTQLG